MIDSLDQVSPNKDSESVHQEVDSSLDPYLLVLLDRVVEILETGVFQSFDQRLILRKVLIWPIRLWFEHLTQKDLTRYQVLEHQTLLGWSLNVNHFEMLLGFLELFIH